MPVVIGPLPPPLGGITIFMQQLFAHLQPAGVDFWAPGRAPTPGVRRLGFKGWRLIPLLCHARGQIILDSIERFIEYPAIATTLPWLAMKRLVGFRWVKVIHDGAFPVRFAAFPPWRRRLLRLAAAQVDTFVVVDPALQPWLRDELGVRCDIRVIGPLLPWTAADRAETLDERYEAALGVGPMVCSIGLFNEAYGFLHAAQAVEQLRRESGRDYGLLLLDGGFGADPAYRRAVLAGRPWIRVLTAVPHAQVLRLLERCQVMVRPFRFESYGLARVEALWCGVPVVATNVGETRGMACFAAGQQEALVTLLRRALQGDHDHVAKWAAHFRSEAEVNLRAWRTVLGVGGPC